MEEGTNPPLFHIWVDGMFNPEDFDGVELIPLYQHKELMKQRENKE